MSQRLNKQNYYYVGRYKVPTIYSPFVGVPDSLLKPTFRLKGLPLLTDCLYLDGYCFFKNPKWQTVREMARQAAETKNEDFFSSFFAVMKRTTAKMMVETKKLKKNKITANSLNSFFVALNDMEYPWWTSLPIGEGLEIVLNHHIRNKELTWLEAQDLLVPSKLTFSMKQMREIKKIKQQFRKDVLAKIVAQKPDQAIMFIKTKHPVLYKKIKVCVKKYKWFGMMHFWGEPFSEEKFIEQLSSEMLENKRVKKTRLSNNLVWLKKISAELCYWRQLCADTCAIASYSFFLAGEKIGQEKAGIGYDLVMALTPQELILLCQGNFNVDVKQLKERKKSHGFINQKIITGRKLSQAVKTYVGKVEDAEVITGQVANQGKVTGRVKVIFVPAEISKVKKGDILVTTETTPDFMLAIYKAKALITDIGGISSHAAIVSREFNIPCIIGTKIATQVLKDGDLVEVDANQGIIRRLE